MLRINNTFQALFNTPRLFFTLKGNSVSEQVIGELKSMLGSEQECIVFTDANEVKAMFESGISPDSAVVLFDSGMIKQFSPTTQLRPGESSNIPSWAYGAQWCVRVGRSCRRIEGCARQLRADFVRNFQDRIGIGYYPWGKPRLNEKPPMSVNLGDVSKVIGRLNSGPDFAQAIADQEKVLELPKDSKISWIRIPPEPLVCDETSLKQIMMAFDEFEESSCKLTSLDSSVPEMLFSGVDLNGALKDIYLFPTKKTFSVRRPDLHFTGDGVFASENDEMPGGFAELVHLDQAYGVNQDRWRRCFDWLVESGPILFLVSHKWSLCYMPEIKWLVEDLRRRGYPAFFLSTEHLDCLTINSHGVYLGEKKIGTIWRQFPIFETEGNKLGDLVCAARDGFVRMVPEFAHFGNKAWFSIFRSRADFFRRELSLESFSVLDTILPDSHLVRPHSVHKSFPCSVAGLHIVGILQLIHLEEEERNRLVLKVCGANTLSARSYGVLIGHGLTSDTWSDWIKERLGLNQPFIVQRRLESGVVRIPVMNTRRNCGEAFSCRILLRPWMVGGELVSVSACAVPSNTFRVHGMVDMAVAPVVFG
ncbi:MAG: hypothetical protein Q8Q95_02440 [bacterium]|nr:hypothetical protein [bacterium]